MVQLLTPSEVRISHVALRVTPRVGQPEFNKNLYLRAKTRLINERDMARATVLLSPKRPCIHPQRTQESALTLQIRLLKRIIHLMHIVLLRLPHRLAHRRLQ